MTTEFSRVYDATIHDPNVEDVHALKQMNITEEKNMPIKKMKKLFTFYVMIYLITHHLFLSTKVRKK